MANREQMIRELKRQDMISSLKAMDSQAQPEEFKYKDEMPEWLSGTDRAVVKNLSNNNDEAIKYLQGKYPDAEFTHNGGEVYARKKGEREYRTLDPSFSPISNPIGTAKDLFNDVTDLGYDAAQMGAEAIGAAAGTAVAPGVGTAAGAGLAAGATSAGRELLRKEMGLTDEVSGTDIAKDAALAAVLPKAFQLAGKGTKAALTKAAPRLYAKATGLTTGALKRIADKGDELATMNERGALNRLTDVGDTVDDFVTTNKQRFAQRYKQLRGGSEEIDIAGTRSVLGDAIREAQEKATRTGLATDQRYLQSLQQMDDEIFGAGAKQMQGISDAMDLDSRISNDWIDWADDVGQGVGAGRSVSGEQEKLAKALRERLRGDINVSTHGNMQNTADEYKDLVEQVNYLRKNFKDPKKTQATFKALNDGKDISLTGGFQSLPQHLQDAINTSRSDIDLYRYFQPVNGSILTQEGLKEMAVGKTPIEKLLTALGTGTGYVTGGAVGGVVGAGAGRFTGKTIANPKMVKAVAKGGKKAGEQMAKLEKLLEENPALLNAIYGAGYAGTSK